MTYSKKPESQIALTAQGLLVEVNPEEDSPGWERLLLADVEQSRLQLRNVSEPVQRAFQTNQLFVVAVNEGSLGQLGVDPQTGPANISVIDYSDPADKTLVEVAESEGGLDRVRVQGFHLEIQNSKVIGLQSHIQANRNKVPSDLLDSRSGETVVQGDFDAWVLEGVYQCHEER